MKKCITKGNWPRVTLQWGVLLALILFITGIIPSKEAVDPESLCPMGGLQALATYGVRGSLPCSMSSLQILMGVALAFAVIFFSKLFCGYLCPIGTVEDLLLKLRRKLHIKNIPVNSNSVADKVLRIFKYLLLFYVFYATTAASELVCKQFDPYYAVATGFHGEIVLWMSVASLALLVIGGLVVDMFWCRYICPLGALSNTLKYWIWVVAVAGVWVALRYLGVDIPWWWQFAVVCAGGYVLEITRKPRFQILSICKNSEKCISCGKCDKACPYHIQVANAPAGPVRSVDCTMCGECVASCSAGALAAGAACSRRSHDSSTLRFVLPALIAIVLPLAGYFAGRNVELPTINETWGMESVDSAGNVTKLIDNSALTTVKLEGLRSVKCFGSSMAFKAKLEKIKGVYGVKTYVGSHSAVVTYDPSVLTEETLQEKIFTPSCFRVNSLDPQALDSLKIYTIRTEHMTDKVDLNYFGLQLRNTSRGIYGVESEFACPLIVRVYVNPAEEFDSDWFKDVVEKKVLAMPIHGGGVKETPVNWKYAGMEDEISYISTPDYLHKMFSPFKAQFKSRLEQFAEAPQMMYEIVDANYEKPIILRNMSFVSNHLSSHDGIIGIYLDLNPELQPAIMVRYAAPMTADKVWELLNMETWTIVYSADDVREVPAKLKFGNPGTEYPYTPERYPFTK